MAETTTKILRDFIYIDVPKLYSMYSQIFEGLTDRVVEERISQEITGDVQRNALRQASTDSKVLEASRTERSGILHDHMYNRLEEAITPAIKDTVDINMTNVFDELSFNPIIKVKGRAEIEDYERITSFFSRFNEIGQIIAYATASSDNDLKERVIKLLVAISKAPNENQRKKLENDLKQMTNVMEIAASNGLLQDPNWMEKLKVFVDLFNPSSYEVLISPPHDTSIHYRGILNRDWLRINPNIIRSTYGGQSESPWVMVGVVTHIPENHQPDTPSDQASVTINNNPMMLDSYRSMFRTSRIFERMFLESQTETDIIVSPIAIYREFQVMTKSLA